VRDDDGRGHPVTDSKGSTGALSGSTPDPGRSGVSASKSAKVATKERRNPLARFGRFLREIVAELRKVIYPTRSELVTYTIVVMVFVSVLTAFIFGLDWGLARAVLYIFGDPDADSGN
jgi:preprotein translocase subunit SecE